MSNGGQNLINDGLFIKAKFYKIIFRNFKLKNELKPLNDYKKKKMK